MQRIKTFNITVPNGDSDTLSQLMDKKVNNWIEKVNKHVISISVTNVGYYSIICSLLYED